jgi:hypothetical protein
LKPSIRLGNLLDKRKNNDLPREDNFFQIKGCAPGLPDFSWYNIPKAWKMYQITTKVYQMAVK